VVPVILSLTLVVVYIVNMEELKLLTEAGKNLGYQDGDLQQFVREQQSMAREERQRARECELQRLDMENKFKMQMMEKESEVRNESVLLDASLSQSQGQSGSRFIPRTPKMTEFHEGQDEMDSYLRRFERYATVNKWPRENWALYLSALLKGKA